MRRHMASGVARTGPVLALSLLLLLSGCATGANSQAEELSIRDVVSLSPVFSSIDELTDASDVVMIATVTSVSTFGIVDAGEDPNPSEWALLTFKPERVLRGNLATEPVVAWEMFVTDGHGKRLFELTHDGVPNPEVGDRYLLFAVLEEAARREVFGGATTHAIIVPVGIMAIIDGQVHSTYRGGSAVGTALDGRSESELASLLEP